MRKLTSLVLVLIMLFTLAACGQQPPAAQQSQPPQVQQPASQTTSNPTTSQPEVKAQQQPEVKATTVTQSPATPAPTVAPSTQTQKQDITVYVTKTGSKYHRSGCRYLSKSQIPISLSDAKASGYTACSVCGPPR